MHVAIVTNIPAPYRLPVFDRCAKAPGVRFTAVFLAGREPDRDWNLPSHDVGAIYLRPRFLSWRGRYIHLTTGVYAALRKLAPDVVITTGFNPAHLAGFRYARRRGKPHVVMSDGTSLGEGNLTWLHRRIRHYVFERSQAFIGASEGTRSLFRQYQVEEARVFKSSICCDLTRFYADESVPKTHDLMFAGRFVDGKSPDFVLRMAYRVSKLLQRQVRVLMAGSGPLESALRDLAAQLSPSVDAEFSGFARQEDLPSLYQRARIFVLPSRAEAWGVVVNEACACGLPVMTTPETGSAGEIVVSGENGYVLPLDIEAWAHQAASLLSDRTLCERMGARSLEIIRPYNFDVAADGLLAAARHALSP